MITPRITIAARLLVEGEGEDAGSEGVREDEDGDGQEGLAPHEGECGAGGRWDGDGGCP